MGATDRRQVNCVRAQAPQRSDPMATVLVHTVRHATLDDSCTQKVVPNALRV